MLGRGGRDRPGREGRDGKPGGIKDEKEDILGNPGNGGREEGTNGGREDGTSVVTNSAIEISYSSTKVKSFKPCFCLQITAATISFFPSATVSLFLNLAISLCVSATRLSACLAAIQFS